jgi:hypothetical protein
MRARPSAWVGLVALLAACSIRLGPEEQPDMSRAWGEKPATEGVRKDFDVVIGGTPETTVGSIEWRAALDVFVNIPDAPAFGGSALLGSFWKIYAVAGGMRVAVAGNASAAVGANYVCGIRNVVCDHFDVTVQNPNGEVTAPGEPVGRVTLIAWGTDVTGAPEPIPAGFPSPPGSSSPVTVIDPIQPKGGAGTFGTGTVHDGIHSGVLENHRLVGTAGNRANLLLVEMIGYTTAPGQNWIQIFDSPGPAGYPANGIIADYDFPITQNQGVSFFPEGGIRFRDGIKWALSSTPRVMTQVAGAGTCWFDTSFYR